MIFAPTKHTFKLNPTKVLSLRNILHALNIHRNLISPNLLNTVGVRVTFDFGKVALTNGGEFVGKSFCNEMIFILNLVVENNVNAHVNYIAKSISLWHAKLGHMRLYLLEDFKN